MKIIVVIAIVISITTYFFKKKAPSNKRKAEFSPEEFVKCIEEKGYFKYTDSARIKELKDKIIEEFHPESTISTIEDDSVRYPLEYRLYFCDGESVYEDGGFTDLLNDLKPTFNKTGLPVEVTEHYEEWDDKNGLNHWLTLNGKKYIIFKNFKDVGWGEAPALFANMINDQLEINGIKERIYLISGGNEGMLIFLTPELQQCFMKAFVDPVWQPLPVDEWCKVMNVKLPNY